jgi:hypothetical protein
MATGPQLSVLVIERPAEKLGNRKVEQAWLDLLRLRMLGYRHDYAGQVLPLDTYDFLATHIAAGIAHPSGEFQPLMAFRTLTLGSAAAAYLPLIAGAEGFPDEVRAPLDAVLEGYTPTPEALAYVSAWVIHPAWRGRPEMRDLTYGLVLAWHVARAQHWLSVNVLRTKGDARLAALGGCPVGEDGLVANPRLGGETGRLMLLSEPNSCGQELAQQYLPLLIQAQHF